MINQISLTIIKSVIYKKGLITSYFSLICLLRFSPSLNHSPNEQLKILFHLIRARNLMIAPNELMKQANHFSLRKIGIYYFYFILFGTNHVSIIGTYIFDVMHYGYLPSQSHWS